MKKKWEQFKEWYYYAHPLVQALIAAPIGGIIGGLITLLIYYSFF